MNTQTSDIMRGVTLTRTWRDPDDGGTTYVNGVEHTDFSVHLTHGGGAGADWTHHARGFPKFPKEPLSEAFVTIGASGEQTSLDGTRRQTAKAEIFLNLKQAEALQAELAEAIAYAKN